MCANDADRQKNEPVFLDTFRVRAKHVLFSMLHPLDEVAPVICKTGGNTSLSKVAFVTESSQKLVFTSEEPSLVMTYDKILGVHAVWTLRRAKPDVCKI